ncbi:MAG: hypothetical protein PHV82_19425, partial [Victivallaceae bacterium]|nr:hypothetical protein [Victivallaceae bacterium]
CNRAGCYEGSVLMRLEPYVGKLTRTVLRGENPSNRIFLPDNTLGLWFRVYFDLGVREQDHRGMVKAIGA